MNKDDSDSMTALDWIAKMSNKPNKSEKGGDRKLILKLKS